MIKVSVIIPVYGVERFVARCARTLMEQTMQDVEYIFVNDATPDRSIEVLRAELEKYPWRKPFVRILEHKHNLGLPAARNTGLAVARGEYIFHCDSDDFLETNALDQMYKTAITQDADIVWCDWYLSLSHSERYMSQPGYDNPLDALKAMMGGGMKFNVWNKLAKRNLYTDNGIQFPSGYGMAEDMTMMQLFAFSRRVAYLPQALYHYIKTNENALSRTYSDNHLKELKYNMKRTELFITRHFGDKLSTEIAFMKLEAKFPLLLLGNHRMLMLWSELYPEANPYILSNKYISLRSKLLQWCAWKKQYWLVRLYNYILQRVVYGILFR